MIVMPHTRIINSLVSENKFSAYGAPVPVKAFVGSMPVSAGLLVKTTEFSFLTPALFIKRPLEFYVHISTKTVREAVTSFSQGEGYRIL